MPKYDRGHWLGTPIDPQDRTDENDTVERGGETGHAQTPVFDTPIGAGKIALLVLSLAATIVVLVELMS